MKRILSLALFFCGSAAEAQTAAKEPTFTVDKIVGAVGLPLNFTSNARNRSHGSDPDQYFSPGTSLTAEGKLFEKWTYTFSTGVDYEAYNRFPGLENSVFGSNIQIQRKFGDYKFSLAYTNGQEYDKFFDAHARTLQKFTVSLSQAIEVKDTGWTITPGLDMNRQIAQGVLSDAFFGTANVKFGWSDCSEKKDFKCWDLALRPGFRLTYYERYPVQVRKDLQPSVIAEVAYQITPDVKLSGTVTGRYNDSNIPQGTYRRVTFVPQLSLSRTLYETKPRRSE